MLTNEEIIRAIRLLESSNGFETEPLINALVAVGKPAVPHLLEALTLRDYSTFNAIRVLGQMHATETASHILPFIDDEHLILREAAWYALAKLKYFDNAEPIIDRLSDEESFDVREAMAYALGKIGGDAAIAQLIQLLRDEHSFVVEAASESLISLGDESLPALLEGLKINDEKVRHEVNVTLSLIMDRVLDDRPMKWTGNRDFLLSTIKAFDAGDDEEAREFCEWAIRELER